LHTQTNSLPSTEDNIRETPETVLIASGALARAAISLRDKLGWQDDVLAIPALLHNWPKHIPAAVQKRIAELRGQYKQQIVVYGDCGTAGKLDDLLAAERIERVAGPHCYEMYANGRFDEMMAEAPGTYFLTDYLVQSFDHLVIEGLGLDSRPELREDYFRHYTRVVYLAQRDDPLLLRKAQRAADYLQLPLEIRSASYGALEQRLVALMNRS
jgi:hypothetical protein